MDMSRSDLVLSGSGSIPGTCTDKSMSGLHRMDTSKAGQAHPDMSGSGLVHLDMSGLARTKSVLSKSVLSKSGPSLIQGPGMELSRCGPGQSGSMTVWTTPADTS